MSRSPSMAIRPRQDPNAPLHPTETHAAPQPPAPATPPGKAATEEALDPGGQPLLLEIGWETCNQLGGIYTVLRSKSPEMVRRWGDRYLLIGPYNPENAAVEFEEEVPTGDIGDAITQLREQGLGAHFGRWLVSGRPQVLLLNYLDLFAQLHEVKYRFWHDHGIETPADDPLLNNVLAFGEACRRFLELLGKRVGTRHRLIAHFHEWMAAAAAPMLRRQGWPGSIVFTTHATILGRFLAMNNPGYYDALPHLDGPTEARRYNCTAQYTIERAAAHGAEVFTTVSDVTGEECRHLLGRGPDLLLPNGLNIQRFTALHEFQNLHRQYKQRLHRFTMGHFFGSYHFDLDRTLYFFTSGRYEYRNKGMDLTVEALARLNARLQQADSSITIVAFIITKRPVKSINVGNLGQRAMLREFRTITDAIKNQVGDRLFEAATTGHVPDLNALIDDYWTLRLRRTIQTWKQDHLPSIVTHDLLDDTHDEVLMQLRACQLWNQPENPVKVIYHPQFVTSTNPLFGLEYEQFVRGCNLGIFPSYYEPWGYTPMEAVALGVPAVTSDLSGFGTYLTQLLPDHEEQGVFVTPRRHRSWDESAQSLCDQMWSFCQQDHRQRVDQRNHVEAFSVNFDWRHLAERYQQAHELALDRVT